MPILRNPRHERFAQELAKGKSATEAYVNAGFSHNPGNAGRLKQNENVKNRIEEILNERRAIHEQGVAIAVERVALNKEWVITQLIENVNRAMQASPVMQGGKPTGEFKYDGGVANRALELLGKELGMFVERAENVNTTFVVSGEPVTEEDWIKEHGADTEH